MLGDEDHSSPHSSSAQQPRSSSGSRSSEGTSKISSKSSSNPRRRQQACKYKSLEDCPFGERCRFRHGKGATGGDDGATVNEPTASFGGVRAYEPTSNHLPYPSQGDESTTSSSRAAGGSSSRKRRQVCRYFLKSSCKYGERCTFYHPKASQSDPAVTINTATADIHPLDSTHLQRSVSPCDSDSASEPLLDTVAFPSLQTHGKHEEKAHKSTTGVAFEVPVKHRQPAGRGREPAELSLGDFLLKVEPRKAKHPSTSTQPRPPVPRPHTKIITSDLREAELQQLQTMYPDCQLVEKSKQSTVYRINFTPSNPQWTSLCTVWNIKGKCSIPLLITIPAAYPSEVLEIVIADDQGLNPLLVTYGNSRFQAYLEAESRAFRGTLMLRSVVYWIEEHLIGIFTEALKQESSADEGEASSDGGGGSECDDDAGSSGEEPALGDEASERGGKEGGVAQPAKRGTEVRLVGVRLSEGVATVQCSSLKLVLACSRCKAPQDVTARPESRVSESCVRCHSCLTVLYHPSLLHAASTTLGFLDLLGCTVQDVVLLQSELAVVCLECGKASTSRGGLSYGELKDSWCRRCHSKLTLFAEQFKLVQHQPGSIVPEVSKVSPHKKAKKRNQLIKEGEPLPEYGTCLHYKKSHRWLRFPCCGKAYPCDVCHDSTEDHAMERATRMLCGFCAKEQPYNGTKPCVLCGSDLTNARKSTHWEGGLGCRNRTKMSRNDKHKYSGSTNKTSCKKVERVGEKPTSNH